MRISDWSSDVCSSDLERLSRAYIQAFARIIGPDRDIPAPDVYTNAMIMGWMADEYAQIVGQAEPAAITGKPIALGGSLGRAAATARGGSYLVRRLASALRLCNTLLVAIPRFRNPRQNLPLLLASLAPPFFPLSHSTLSVNS